MAQQTLYKKVGRRYVPVSEYDPECYDSWPYGTHLVVSAQYSVLRRFQIDPNTAGLLAAGLMIQDQLANFIRHMSEAEPNPQPITPRARELWEELQLEFGGRFHLTYPSATKVASKTLELLSEEFEEMMTDPRIQAEFERFMTLVMLAREDVNA